MDNGESFVVHGHPAEALHHQAVPSPSFALSKFRALQAMLGHGWQCALTSVRAPGLPSSHPLPMAWPRRRHRAALACGMATYF